MLTRCLLVSISGGETGLRAGRTARAALFCVILGRAFGAFDVLFQKVNVCHLSIKHRASFWRRLEQKFLSVLHKGVALVLQFFNRHIVCYFLGTRWCRDSNALTRKASLQQDERPRVNASACGLAYSFNASLLMRNGNSLGESLTRRNGQNSIQASITGCSA